MSVSILFVCTATHVPWRRVQKAYLVGIAKSFADFCTCFSLVITPHNMSVSILFVCTATHVPWRRVQKAYLVGIAKSFADFCTCFSLVITPHNMSVSILFVCTATHVPWRTGRTKVALVELPAVNMVGFFFCTPFPRRILAWSFVVPRSDFHPPKALKSYIFKRGWKLTVPHLPHKRDLKMWSAVDRHGCFVKLSRSIELCRTPEGYAFPIPNHLLIFAPASAWSLLHITCLSPSSLSALLHMCRDALVGQKLRLLSFPSEHGWFLLLHTLSP